VGYRPVVVIGELVEQVEVLQRPFDAVDGMLDEDAGVRNLPRSARRYAAATAPSAGWL
jgi:hypothetical protein